MDGHDKRLEVELAHFESMASRWWDKSGPCQVLHAVNPARLQFIQEALGSQFDLAGQRVMDIGCGGGILSEALARLGVKLTGIDPSPALIEVAKAHADTEGLSIDYVEAEIKTYLERNPQAIGQFEAVVCFELLEHVSDPEALLGQIKTVLKPGGHLFLSTLNRTPQAFVTAILGAEYLLRLLPRGTHRYADFIRPTELHRVLSQLGFEVCDLKGLKYDPFLKQARLEEAVSVNYLMHAIRLT